MSTLHDLREALASDERQAFDHDRLLAGVRRGVARRRLLRSGSVAAVVLALTAAGLGVTGLPRQVDEPAIPTRPPLSFTIRPSTVDGYQITPSTLTADQQSATVWRSGPTPNGSLRVYEPGRYDPTELRTGEPVTVAGRPGFYRRQPALSRDGQPVSSPMDVTELGWEYAPDAWAVLSGRGMAKDDALKLAPGLVLGSPVPARVPVRLGYLPAGLGVVMVRQSSAVHRSPAQVGRTSALFIDELGTLPDPDREFQGPLRIAIYEGGGDAPVSGVWTPNATVAGHPAVVETGQIQVNFGSFWVFVVGYGPDTERVSVLEQVVAGLTVAPSTDPATWFDL